MIRTFDVNLGVKFWQSWCRFLLRSAADTTFHGGVTLGASFVVSDDESRFNKVKNSNNVHT